ncbi:MAG: TatD family hydrolase [Candidatus Pacebacteria bacterium]|jgi:TatD DNase family protein|nr:TatD family hydrolase [Candidatus Paceibacterota bacterium]
MIPQFFDIHGHLNDVQFDQDRDVVLERMKMRSVGGVVVGTDEKTSREVVEMAEKSPEQIYAAIGIHPIDNRNEKFHESVFAELAQSPRVIAVGECGLDYSRPAEVSDVSLEKKRQRALFEEQIDFAIAHNLPLMLHIRDCDKARADAHRDVLAILTEKKKTAGEALRGDVHFFAQTLEIAREYFALGFTISFTGVITFSREYDEVIREAPLESIMSETDCPYVAPVPYRGKRNEPIYVEEVVKKIAEIRGEDFETVRAQLVANVIRTFNLKV